MARIILLVDNSNIHISTVNQLGAMARFSYINLVRIHSNDTILKKHIFGSTPPKNDDFWNIMRQNGWEVTTYERKTNHAGGTQEKGVDGAVIAWGVAAIKDFRPDILVLLSGDLDMRALIQVAKENGCKVHIWSYKKALSPIIEAASDKCFYIDNYFYDLIFYQRVDGTTETYGQRIERHKREKEEQEREAREREQRLQQLRQEEREQREQQDKQRKTLVRSGIGIGIIGLVGFVIKKIIFK